MYSLISPMTAHVFMCSPSIFLKFHHFYLVYMAGSSLRALITGHISPIIVLYKWAAREPGEVGDLCLDEFSSEDGGKMSHNSRGVTQSCCKRRQESVRLLIRAQVNEMHYIKHAPPSNSKR